MKHFLVILGTLLISSSAFSWGKLGHRITGQIAQDLLSEKAKLEVQKIIGNESLAQISNWPDFIKSNPEMRKKYSAWHYVSFPKTASLEKRKVSMKGDIFYGIKTFTKVLKDKDESQEEKRKALAFIVHLVGDIHQPLHVGYPEDKGGNKLSLSWFGSSTNLHGVWDEKLIQSQELSFTEYSKEIKASADPAQFSKWQKSDVALWAQESRDYLPKVYQFKQGKYWEYAYSYKHIGFVNERLLKGGVRLAGLLNSIL